ncbi:NnrU family protein [Sulfitobacter sp. M57]|uniref:NnrU family protein n=1 Tax=unclassified Sulfitobacter TaxID=196795 RepID=UPI0023E22789|nr:MULTISPECIES: NnrU family protein [unclassified Sulfitobacter]MDF3416631.1 NnrU family protein [Sulfitobacter sp. KE5]MDF3424111.1 NnrU family protein [Sulfitobacter sp. KE43]MDF3435176.1 NnrU family protein [Sulfitobacter sp. KE42]MDF3460820.1 NnrU family protein [Sulfitobacter sp. S74]MDF3464713.1 NnrU family protein [Sulfitobacter sp. Ks18]
MTWAGYAAVFIGFFLTHSIPVRPRVKSQVAAKIGARGFGILYSMLSLAMFALLIWATGEAPYVQLWSQLQWHRHVTHLGMLVVCLILALTIARPNPFSFGGTQNDAYDPAHPGITRWARHPVLMALALWAAVHLVPNGDLAHVILFGVLASFAIAGRSLIDTRKRGQMGNDRWQELDLARQAGPRFQMPTSWAGPVLRLAIGVAVFAILLLVHPYVIGVRAL